MPVVGTSQVLHYEISDGNGYTFVSSAGGELSQGALATSPCYFEYFPPNIIELYQLTSSGDTFLGEGYIGGSWSYPSTNGIIGGSGGLPGPGTCSIDLNQSRRLYHQRRRHVHDAEPEQRDYPKLVPGSLDGTRQ